MSIGLPIIQIGHWLDTWKLWYIINNNYLMVLHIRIFSTFGYPPDDQRPKWSCLGECWIHDEVPQLNLPHLSLNLNALRSSTVCKQSLPGVHQPALQVPDYHTIMLQLLYSITNIKRNRNDIKLCVLEHIVSLFKHWMTLQ